MSVGSSNQFSDDRRFRICLNLSKKNRILAHEKWPKISVLCADLKEGGGSRAWPTAVPYTSAGGGDALSDARGGEGTKTLKWTHPF